ncbi:hypothetical protein [Priestia megaterium]|uniref:hypothetical protein n=1 Tax=Priestia megaterium TaxID=1404 RepID=UPI002877E91B|nr:hypothetical protein [Priestia megaterium]
MTVDSLLEEVRRYGSELSLDGDKLIVKEAYKLPRSLIEQLKLNKHKFIKTLRNDELAKKAEFIIGVSGLLYEYTLNKHSSLYLEQLNKKWFVWRETYQRHRSEAINSKVIESGNEFEYVLLKAKKYIKFVQDKASICFKSNR